MTININSTKLNESIVNFLKANTLDITLVIDGVEYCDIFDYIYRNDPIGL